LKSLGNGDQIAARAYASAPVSVPVLLLEGTHAIILQTGTRRWTASIPVSPVRECRKAAWLIAADVSPLRSATRLNLTVGRLPLQSQSFAGVVGV